MGIRFSGFGVLRCRFWGVEVWSLCMTRSSVMFLFVE